MFNWFSHIFNPLHIYCRAVDLIGEKNSKRICKLYEKIIWKPMVKLFKMCWRNIMKIFESLIGYDKDVTKEINVSGAVILKNNEDGTSSVLLIQRAHDDHFPDVWEIPRGKCTKKEKLKDCLKREVKEETGLDIDILEYLDKFEYIADHGTRKSTQYNFLCRMINPKQKVKLSKEHQDFRWTSTVGEVELLTSGGEIKKTIARVLNYDQKIVIYKNTQEVIDETTNVWQKNK